MGEQILQPIKFLRDKLYNDTEAVERALESYERIIGQLSPNQRTRAGFGRGEYPREKIRDLSISRIRRAWGERVQETRPAQWRSGDSAGNGGEPEARNGAETPLIQAPLFQTNTSDNGTVVSPLGTADGLHDVPLEDIVNEGWTREIIPLLANLELHLITKPQTGIVSSLDTTLDAQRFLSAESH